MKIHEIQEKKYFTSISGCCHRPGVHSRNILDDNSKNDEIHINNYYKISENYSFLFKYIFHEFCHRTYKIPEVFTIMLNGHKKLRELST